MAKSLSEVKFAVEELLFDELGLDAQDQVDLVQGTKSMEDIRSLVMSFARSPAFAGKPGVLKRIQQALSAG